MKSLRIVAAIVVVFSLAGVALATEIPAPRWPFVPPKPTGPAFKAVASGGDWHSTSTWTGHVVPGNGAVVTIPYGATVTLSGTTARLRWVEVDGNLVLSSTASTTMFVDTLRVAITKNRAGTLFYGRLTLNSLPGNLTAKVIFTSNGQFVTGDTQKVSRGLIGEGVVHVIGQTKTNMATVSSNLPANTTQFNLDAAPLNWTAGDSIVIAGTHFRRLAPMQDERCKIGSINGTLITLVECQRRDGTLATSLAYDHLLTSTANNQSPQNTPVIHVANLTRNVVFSSESTVHTIDRGHVLIGHQDSDIENVEFVDLGRTDKSKPLDDYVVGSTLNPATGTIANLRGRYPLYVFNTVGNPPGVNEAIPHTTIIKGCVVERSIGWAFANRRSNVNFTNNVAYNFIGAGFVAEGGDELGSYVGNIAIHGAGQILIDQPLGYQTTLPDDVNHYRKQRLNFMNPTRPQPIEDIAFNGEGFWFSGPALHVDGNVANSCHGTGMIWHPTGVVEVSAQPSAYPFGRYTYFPQAWIHSVYGSAVPSGYPLRHWSHGSDEMLTGDLPILYCNNFTGYANFVGFRLRFSNEDNAAWYNETPTNPWNYQSQVIGTTPTLTARPYQAVSNLNLWNNEAAITLTYDANTNFSDVNGISRLDYDENSPSKDPGISPNYGLQAYFIVANLNWTKLTLDGYELATWTDDGPHHATPPLSFMQQTYPNSVHDGLWSSNCTPPGPPSVSTDGTGTVSWGASPGATAYLVRYRGLGDQQWSFTAPQNPPPPPNPQPTTAPISGLTPGKTYQIQVDAGCSTGISPWVSGNTFNGSCAPAAISAQPADAMNVPSGQMATFSVAASGAGPFSYQWYEGAAGSMDNPVGGDSNILSVMPAASTSYWVNVTNACGAATSNAALVTVCNPPAITAQTQSQTITDGTSVALAVTADGNGPTYQWYQGEAPSTAVPIGTSSSLTVTPSETTSYWVNVTNGCGSTASDTIVITVCDPPTIIEQPISQTIPAGSAVTLDVLAGGSGPFTYQWYLGAAPSTANPIDTDDSPLTVAPASTTSYWVSVTNDCGSVASNTVTVTLCNPPTIVTQPQSQMINIGSSATLSVTAGGDGTFSYQWYSGGTPIGGNSSTLTVSPSVTTSYWVSVSSFCGATPSSPATVTVCGPAAIATQPASQTIDSGSQATLTVVASGGGTYSYQWYEGTRGTVTTPVGTNSSTFVTPPLTTMKSYWVRVTATCLGTSTADSATATIFVQIPIVRRQLAGSNANSMPTITTNWSQPTQAGSLLVAVISASDVAQIGAFTPPAGWQLANTNSYSNIKTSIYYYPNNPGGRTAETFHLTNYPDSTLDLIEYTGVMSSPLDQIAIDEGSAPIGMVAVDTGTTQPTAKPREVVVTALTTYAQSTFTTPNNSFVKIDEQSVLYHLTTAVHERIVNTTGSYGHQANVGGNAQWVGLAVTFMAFDCSAPPTISSQPGSVTINAGQQTTLTVTAAGSGFTYQWYQGAAPSTTTPVGTNSSTLTVAPATTTSYWVNVSSACGSTASNTATVTVCAPPSITTQPLSQTITAGSSVTLSVTADSNGPFSYQWYQGASGTTTTPVGTNSTTLTVTPAATTSYWVKVSNACGATNSNTATVTICNPVIVTQPSSQTINAGSSATLSVAAGGGTPFTYQWYQGASGTTTTPVGTNSSTFTVTPAATTSYWVKVTNSCGTINSNTATITVLTHIARRQLAAANANSMSSLTANWTQATQAGSLLVAILSASDTNTIGAFTPPAGWQQANTYSFNNVKTSIYYYPNNPGGRTAETFHLTNFPDSTLDLIEYTGVMAASPLDKTGFDGNWNPVNGIVTSGTTPSTAQSKEVVITALTTYAQTSFTNATNGFTKIDEQGVLSHLTTAVHENIVTTAGSWGHSASAGGSAPWVGLVVTFKSADTTP